MIKLDIESDELEKATTPDQRKKVIEPEIDQEILRFKEHWAVDLGLGSMLTMEEAAVRTYIRWRLVKG